MNNIEELLENNLIIPEIQRDYVWGNNELVIKRFINNIKNMKDELDIGFFYSYKIYEDYNALVDGQQRITTLILLSWYVDVDNVELNKFKFKVRENSNNFLEELLKQKSEKIFEIDGKNFSDKIKNSIWYKRIWDNDPTVKSILNALDIIDKELKNEKEDIKNKINNIKFSCIEAGDRNLEKEYILLNSRGVKLTNSEQLKAILTEDIENKGEWLEKWEKDWQDILWECKGDNIYNTDKIWYAVLYWVRDIYVIENNIYKNSDKEKKEINYNFDLIGIEKENREKVLEILDWIIPVLKIINYNLDIQDKCQFKNIEPPIIGIKVIDIKDKIQGKVNDNSKEYSLTIKEKALFYSILYLIKNEYNIKSIDNIENENIQLDNDTLDKIRIFRNLIQNSTINASNLHNAVNSLKNFDINKLGELKGLDEEQQEEEALKIEIFEKYEEYKDLIIEIENDDLFRGKIKKLFLLFLSIEIENEKLEDNYKKDFYKNKRDILLQLLVLENNKTKFKNLFDIYKGLNSKKKDIWGELLLEKDVYKYKSDKNYICLKYNEEYGFLKLVYLYVINVDKNISDNSIKLEEFLNKNRKEKLNITNSEDFLKITEPKQQLYILYVIGYDNGYFIFTKINNNKNFGVYGNRYEYKDKNKNRLENSPFNHKLVFQSYGHNWVGGQPYVKTEEFIKEFNIQNFLEEYIK